MGRYHFNVALGASLIASAVGTTTTVNLNTKFQTITGFGFSEAFGSSDEIFYLESTAQKKVLDLLFSPTTGAGMNIVRNRIAEAGEGAIEPNAPSSPSATPVYVPLMDSQVWFCRQAKTYGVSTFMLDAWSAPAFMKTNDDANNGGYLCGVTNQPCKSGDWRQAYANYLVKNAQDWISEGVVPTHLGFLNEPQFSGSYSSMRSSGYQAASFLKVLQPTVERAGLKINLTCCDGEGWQGQEIMLNQIAASNASDTFNVVTSHWYTSLGTSPLNTTLPVWMTEYADLGEYSFTPAWYKNGGFNEGLTWANLIYNGLHNTKLSAFLHWIGAQNSTSASTLITFTGDTSNPVVTPSGSLWAFGHFARYVRPGAVRVQLAGVPSGLNMTAFHNTDGSVSVQAINGGALNQQLTLATNGFKASKVASYLTNNAHNLIATYNATLSNGMVTAQIPSRSLVTLVLTS